MKVYMSADMEGITGVTTWDEAERPHDDYPRFRRIFTDEVNAAVEGALAGGATEIVVNDSHDSMRNLLIEHLHPKARLLSGNVKRLSMMEGLDESFDAVFLIGYHSPAGTTASVLDHTYTSTTQRIEINGIEAPEYLIFGAIAGHLGIPVKLLTGDETVCAMFCERVGTIETVAVKQSVSRLAALSYPPEVTHPWIRESATRAMSTAGQIIRFDAPYTLRVRFQNTRQTDNASIVPLAKRVDAYTLDYSHEDYLVIIDALRAMCHLSYR